LKPLKFDTVFRFAAVVLLLLALPGFLPSSVGGHTSGFLNDVILAAGFGLIGVILFFTGTLAKGRREQIFWTLLAAGLMVQVFVTGHDFWHQFPGSDSVWSARLVSFLEDSAYLVFFLLVAGALMVDRSRRRKISVYEKISLGVFFLGLLAFCTLSAPIIEDGEGGKDELDWAWSYTLYIVLDLYLITVAALRAFNADSRRWALVCRCLATSMLMFLAVDLLVLSDYQGWIADSPTEGAAAGIGFWHLLQNLFILVNLTCLAAAARIALVFVDEDGAECEQSRRRYQLVESTSVVPPMVVFIFVMLFLTFGSKYISFLNDKDAYQDQETVLLALIFTLTILAMLHDRWLAKQRRKLLQKVENYDTRLQQSQKLEAVGRLVGGVAHDFNNQIHVISNCNDELLRQTPAGDPRRTALEMISRASKRSSEAVNQLFLLKEGQETRSDHLDMVRVVESMRPSLTDLIGRNIDLKIEGDCAGWVVVADPVQVQSVVTNLVLNARDASSSGGTIAVKIRAITLEEIETIDALVVPSSEIKGDCIEMAVIDGGMGIPLKDQGRIFEPFFSSKSRESGSGGLGLYKTYGFINELGGSIAVDSTPGKGTTIRVFFPATAKAELKRALLQESPRVGNAPAASPQEKVHVLLVDDEEDLRNSLALGLENHGIDVTPVASGKEALEIFEKLEGSPEAINVVVTDMVMPGMAGDELARLLLEIRPSLQMIYISGNREPKEALNAQVGGSSTFLRKPFSPEALLRQIHWARDQNLETNL